MDLRLEKYSLVERIFNVSDDRVLAAIRNLLDSEESDQDERISIEQYNRELDESLEDYERNGGMSHEEVGKAMGIL